VPAYRLEIQTGAERDLERLSPLILDRVEGRIRRLAGDPRSAGTQKLSGAERYRVRVGDHRIIYKIDDASRIVTVTQIGHRRDVYRKLR
jgi:mRNA interferase RelE/StbE